MHGMRFAHIGLKAKNPEEMIAYYCEKLGFKLKFTLYHEDGSIWLHYLEISDTQFVELFPLKEDDAFVQWGEEQSFFHWALSVDNLAETVKQLQQNGVDVYYLHSDAFEDNPIVGDYKPAFAPACGSLVAFLKDPAGNLIELQEYTEKSLQLK